MNETILNQITQSIVDNEYTSLSVLIENLYNTGDSNSKDDIKRKGYYKLQTQIKTMLIKECVAISHIKPLKALDHRYFSHDNREKETLQNLVMIEIIKQKNYHIISNCLLSNVISHSFLTSQMLRHGDMNLFNYIKNDEFLEFDYSLMNSLKDYAYETKNLEFVKEIEKFTSHSDKLIQSLEKCFRVGFVEGIDFLKTLYPQEFEKGLDFFIEKLKTQNFFSPFDNVDSFTKETTSNFANTINYFKNQNKEYYFVLKSGVYKIDYKAESSDFSTSKKEIKKLLNLVFKNEVVPEEFIKLIKNDKLLKLIEKHAVNIEKNKLNELISDTERKTQKEFKL
jgi:hypothetical protein